MKNIDQKVVSVNENDYIIAGKRQFLKRTADEWGARVARPVANAVLRGCTEVRYSSVSKFANNKEITNHVPLSVAVNVVAATVADTDALVQVDKARDPSATSAGGTELEALVERDAYWLARLAPSCWSRVTSPAVATTTLD